MARARGQNAVMALAFEAVYGTPPANGYKTVPFVSSQLGAEQGLIESDLLGFGRYPQDPTYDIVTNDGDVVVPLDARALGHWLHLLFGPPITGPSGGAFQHTFASGASQLPSASIEIGHPDAGKYSTHYGVGANTFQIQMQRSGLASATIGLIGKGETVPANVSSVGAAAAIATVSRFASASGSVTIDGVAVGEVVSANINFSNGLDKDETIRGDGEINGIDAGMPSASISLTTKFADVTLYNKATSKTPVMVALTWTRGALAFKIEFGRLFLPRSKKPITGPGGIQAQFNAIGSAGGAPLFIATLFNDIESYA